MKKRFKILILLIWFYCLLSFIAVSYLTYNIERLRTLLKQNNSYSIMFLFFIILYSAFLIFLFLYFLIIIFQNKGISDRKKIIWILLIVFPLTFFFIIPVIWCEFIWKNNKKDVIVKNKNTKEGE